MGEHGKRGDGAELKQFPVEHLQEHHQRANPLYLYEEQSPISTAASVT